jgi:hypothetical protein
LTEAAGPWNPELSLDDDGEYFCRVILASAGICFVADARVFYRQSHGTLSYIGRSDRKLDSQFRSLQLQIGHLLNAEASPRVRAACLSCLQLWLVFFYPERPDLSERLQQMASSLGGNLVMPRLSWKYRWVQRLFGLSAAKLAQLVYNRGKTSLLDAWDRACFQLESRLKRRVLPDVGGEEEQIRRMR